MLTALLAQYFNVFVLVIQSFLKIGPLHALAPSVPPSEPPFAIVQGIVLVFFIIVIVGAIRRFHADAAICVVVIPGRASWREPGIRNVG